MTAVSEVTHGGCPRCRDDANTTPWGLCSLCGHPLSRAPRRVAS